MTPRSFGCARLRGFTLIELLIAVAVIAILAAISYPSYTRYVERTQFNDGRSGLSQAAQLLERCYVTDMTYEGCTVPDTSPEGFYTIAASDLTTQGFLLTATGARGRVLEGACSEITLNQAGITVQGACPH